MKAKSNMLKKLTCAKISAAVFAGALVMPVAAQAQEHTSGVTISPMVGRYLPARNRGLDDSTFISIGLGYDFDSPWSIEATYLESEPEVMGSSTEVDFKLFRLDGLYHFSDGRYRPYVVFGAGESEYSFNGGDVDDTIANVGVGIKYALNQYFSLRGDARLSHGMDSGESDYLVGLGAVFKFGADSSAPAKPAKAAAPVKAVAPVDSDGDGVSDANDACPSTGVGVQVDAKGCAVVLDADGDGVVDAKDQCPDTKAGAKVDATGCYQVLKEDVSVSLNVNFATNSDKVVSGSMEDIQEVADFLKSYPLANVVIEGHTDSQGAASYNRNLSQRRAEAVAKILVEEYGVEASRVSSIGYGEDKPLVDNSTAANRAKNRRVTAVVRAVKVTQ